jgi:D-alanine-D-alanine ligase-like ATP-grasp enzyme
MMKVSSSLPDLVVLRGGADNFKRSLQDGADVLASLTKIGYEPVDVLIDKEGQWTVHGFPTDPHKVYTRAHTVVDTTRMTGQPYQAIAKRMNIPLIFSKDEVMTLDREDLYRLLRQQQIQCPDTLVVRANQPLKDSLFREVWTKFHTPILVRPLHPHRSVSSKIIKIFHDLEATVRKYHEEGVDIHILTYKKAHTTSMAILPQFRKQKIYVPMWVDTFPEEGSLPGKDSRMQPHLQAPEFRRENMHAIAKKVYQALGLTTPACIDLVHHNNNYIVVNVDLHPSLSRDGRFMQSLKTTGVDAGHYVHECIKRSYDVTG